MACGLASVAIWTHGARMARARRAFWGAAKAVYGSNTPVQRCRRHKERNVLGYLPKEEQRRLRQVMKAAWRLPAGQGEARLEKEAQALERDHPSAAASL